MYARRCSTAATFSAPSSAWSRRTSRARGAASTCWPPRSESPRTRCRRCMSKRSTGPRSTSAATTTRLCRAPRAGASRPLARRSGRPAWRVCRGHSSRAQPHRRRFPPRCRWRRGSPPGRRPTSARRVSGPELIHESRSRREISVEWVPLRPRIAPSMAKNKPLKVISHHHDEYSLTNDRLIYFPTKAIRSLDTRVRRRTPHQPLRRFHCRTRR